MDSHLDIFLSQDPLPHASVVLGRFDDLEDILRSALMARLGEEMLRADNPDLIWRRYESLGIDESRELKEIDSRKSLSDWRIFVLGIGAITPEAQNSLLKILEEPQVGTHFILVISDRSMLLPTVLSRCQVVEGVIGEKKEGGDLAKTFLTHGHAKRKKIVEDLVKEYEDGDKTAPGRFVQDLCRLLAEHTNLSTGDQAEALALEETQKGARRLMHKPQAPRLVLDHLALIIPIHKAKDVLE